MKTHKRIIALAITLIFAISSFVSVSSFAAEENLFTDVDAKSVYYEAISSLVSDGVINGYEDGTFKPDNTITRAEFSKLLAVGSTPVGTTFSQTTTQFADVADASSSSAWAIPYIAYAVGIKAINGYEDGTFRPTNPVTYGEAVKMIVCTLGYGSVVDTTLTPWYQGYIDIAFKIGLTKNAIALGDTPAPRGMVAQLIYNMQNSKTATVTPGGNVVINGGDSGNSGSLTNEETDDGILLGVFDYCLTGAGVTKTQVLIDDQYYNIGNLSADTLKPLVGYAVSFKYIDDKKPELTRVTKAISENEIISVEDWQIADVEDDLIKYYADEDDYDEDVISKLSFADDFYVVYNGVIVNPSEIGTGFDLSKYLDVENGKIEFLSNDGNDNDAEVAFVESYITYFVNSVSTSNGVTTFYDKFQKTSGLDPMALDEDEVASVRKITSKGGNLNESTIKGVVKNSVTCVALPYGTKEGASLIVSTITVNGSINQKSSSNQTLKIGTENYELSPYFDMLVDADEIPELNVGDSGKFYLDHLGRIVYFEKTESTNPYALLVSYKKTSGLDASYGLYVYSSGTKFTTYLLKETVKVNGSTIEAGKAVDFLKKNAIATDAEDERYIVQPIRFKSQGSGDGAYITEIETMDKENIEDGNIVPYEFKNSVNTDKAYFANGGKLTYSSSGYAFKNGSSIQFRMNSSTSVYVIPKDLTDTSGYAKKTYSSYFTNDKSYEVEPYDVEGEIAKLVVLYGGTTAPEITPGTAVYLVNEIIDKNDEEDQATKEIEYIQTGKETTEAKLVDADSDALKVAGELKSGDLIKFITENNKIVKIEKVFADGELLNTTGSYKVTGHHIAKTYNKVEDYYQVIYGTVRSADFEGKTLSVIPGIGSAVEFESDYETISIDDNTKYYKFDEDNGFEVSSEGAVALTLTDFEGDIEAARENAAQIVTVIVNKKTVAIYVLGE